MKRLLPIALLLIGFSFWTACDVVEGPFFEEHEGGGGEEIDNPRKVLVLDFTGHTCKSCPKAHRSIYMTQSVYGEKIIPVAFHLGYFAKPQSGDKFFMDFRTEEGALLEPFYEFVSFPIGSVNKLAKEDLSPYPGWAAEAVVYLDQNADIEIKADINYFTDRHKAELDVRLANLTGLTCPMKVAIYLTESHIVAWQKDEDSSPMDVEDYEHNHLFRKSIGGVWGQDLVFGQDSKEVELNESLTFQEDWVADNCSFVIFVYHAETMEVLQVEQFELGEE